jgi:hypothetical protein
MRRASSIAGAGLLLALGLAQSAPAAVPSSPIIVGGDGTAKAKIRTDGVLTAGGTEAILVKKMPPKGKLLVELTSPLDSPDCINSSGVCVPTTLQPAPGAPKFNTTRKGRALLTFVMPSALEFLNFKDPTQSHPVPFVNGQRVQLLAFSFKRNNHGASPTVASGTTLVEVPPPPSS